ncbi:sigma-70 family RNA polymerase sigma factor [Luteimicrobium sp. DT211]|uniref:sigma-70 family RNA polymerase sigma factor n=1 Tax=Luteimicrobium sp. DT211 TaxID=3393412 RepID=UPI003CF595B4
MTTTPARPAATAVDDATFEELVAPMRREIFAHCYRMTGSVQDAEDLVQETYLRAWRAMHTFEHRSSLRTWLYRIATNTCLTHLESRKRRPLPTGLGQPASDPAREPQADHDRTWLEPLPDALVWATEPSDPAAETVTRDSVRLAFVTALQHLTAQQRAVLLLREVLQCSAAETAEALGLTVAGVNSTLQRARAQVARLGDEGVDGATPDLDDPRTRERLAAYVAAFESYDIPGIVRLLADDVVWEMPPFPEWYEGPTQIGTLIGTWCPAQAAGDMRLVPAGTANGLPVYGLYMRSDEGAHRAFQLHQVEVGPDGVTRVVAYFDTALFATFGLPEVWPAGRDSLV